MDDLSRMPPGILHNPTYTKSDYLYPQHFEGYVSNPPTEGYRLMCPSLTVGAKILTFAVTSQTDIVLYEWHFPTDMVKGTTYKVFIGWIPVSTWTSGNYFLAVDVMHGEQDGFDVSTGALETQINGYFTPSDADETQETELGEFTPTVDEEFGAYRFLVYDAASSADADFELRYIRHEYTAWRSGSSLHPLERT